MKRRISLSCVESFELVGILLAVVTLLAVLIQCPMARAEYRVFLLEISNADQSEIKFKKSTLDPIQYSDLYPLKPNHRIRYVDTWRCFESRPNFQELCAKPAPIEVQKKPETVGTAQTP